MRLRRYAILHVGMFMTERIFPSLERPGGVIHYTLQATEPARLLFRCRLDLRWMWPYDAGALGDPHYGWDPGRRALQVSNPGGIWYTPVSEDIP